MHGVADVEGDGLDAVRLLVPEAGRGVEDAPGARGAEFGAGVVLGVGHAIDDAWFGDRHAALLSWWSGPGLSRVGVGSAQGGRVGQRGQPLTIGPQGSSESPTSTADTTSPNASSMTSSGRSSTYPSSRAHSATRVRRRALTRYAGPPRNGARATVNDSGISISPFFPAPVVTCSRYSRTVCPSESRCA